jgi:hypothetical protein
MNEITPDGRDVQFGGQQHRPPSAPSDAVVAISSRAQRSPRISYIQRPGRNTRRRRVLLGIRFLPCGDARPRSTQCPRKPDRTRRFLRRYLPSPLTSIRRTHGRRDTRTYPPTPNTTGIITNIPSTVLITASFLCVVALASATHNTAVRG